MARGIDARVLAALISKGCAMSLALPEGGFSAISDTDPDSGVAANVYRANKWARNCPRDRQEVTRRGGSFKDEAMSRQCCHIRPAR